MPLRSAGDAGGIPVASRASSDARRAWHAAAGKGDRCVGISSLPENLSGFEWNGRCVVGWNEPRCIVGGRALC